MTPLYLAARNGRCDVVRVLLSVSHVDVNASCIGGQTALHAVVVMCHINVVDELVDMTKINVNARNLAGRTPVHEAVNLSRGEHAKHVEDSTRGAKRRCVRRRLQRPNPTSRGNF